MTRSGVVVAVLGLAGLCAPASAQDGGPAYGAGGTTVTIGEAIQLALARSYAVRVAEQDLEKARGQTEQAWSTVYPRVDLDVRYTHIFDSPEPFGGGGDPFGSLGTILGATAEQVPTNAWLAYNERQRQEAGQTISLEAFQGLCFGGAAPPECGPLQTLADLPPQDTGGGGLDFIVEDQINATIAISQTIYSGRAFTAIQAAEVLEEQQMESIRRESLAVVGEVARSYYRAQLAARQVEVNRKSVERLRETLGDITRRVEQGILPPFQQLSTEVEVANLESRLAQAEAGVADAIDALELTIGLPVEQDTALRTPLSLPAQPVTALPLDEAVALAEQQRPDLSSLAVTRKVLSTQVELTRADYLPVISAFANFGVVGPGNAQGELTNLDDWGPQISAGIQMSWNLFSGFATDAQVQQNTAEVRRLDVQIEQTRAAVRLELSRALRAIDSAKRRLAAQDRNVERAELNYRHAEARIREGVSSTTELREASQQLDESRINRLQAVHDLLLAWIDYEVAIGTPPAELRAVQVEPKEAP